MSDKLFIQDGETKREFTDSEYAQYELDKTEAQAKADELAAKAVAKAVLLDRLGMTADEAALLLS